METLADTGARDPGPAVEGLETAEDSDRGADRSPTGRGRPLAELLNPDGTLNRDSGYSGSIDTGGYRLVSGEGEDPRFAVAEAGVASMPGDEYWQPGVQMPGMSGPVYALAALNQHSCHEVQEQIKF